MACDYFNAALKNLWINLWKLAISVSVVLNPKDLRNVGNPNLLNYSIHTVHTVSSAHGQTISLNGTEKDKPGLDKVDKNLETSDIENAIGL